MVDGCKTAIANELRGLEPWRTKFGMPVKVVWADKKDRHGTIRDFHFEPADGWKPGPMNPEKERVKRLCQPAYDWVRSTRWLTCSGAYACHSVRSSFAVRGHHLYQGFIVVSSGSLA